MGKTDPEKIEEKRRELAKLKEKTKRLREQIAYLEKKLDMEQREKFLREFYARKPEIELLLNGTS